MGTSSKIRFSVPLGMTCSIMVIACGVGCSDHRISLDEFIILQEEVAAQERVPGTQPAPPAQVRQIIDEQLGPYEVGPGDVLAVSMRGLEAATSFGPIEVRVDSQGELELPAAGRIHVAGKTLEEVERLVQQGYVPNFFRDAIAHVVVVEPETADVLVRGAVVTPGLIPLERPGQNPLFAVVLSGGVTEQASGQVTVQRLRRPEETVTLNLFDAEGIQEALALPALEDGDVVNVHAATPNTVFVGGLVAASRPQVYPPGTQVNILQALAASGGLRTDVTPREGTLIRRMPDGTDVHVKLDLDRISTGKDPNIELAAGDVVWVPYTVETRVQEWINNNIFFRAGATATAGVNYNATAVEFMNDNSRQTAFRGGGLGGTLEDQFDPFGFLLRNQALRQIPTGP